MSGYVYRDGARLTPYMLYQVERLNADLKRLFGVEVRVTYGIRLHQEQIDIFLQRYVTAANVRGRKVYDTRVWKGVRYYRISNAGTVAVPGYSDHEIQGTDSALDLRDTGRDAGIATMGSARSNWLRANCGKYDMVATGFQFGEAWHYKIRNIYKAVPGAPAGGGTTTPPAAPKKRRKPMTTAVVYTDDAQDKNRSGAIVDLSNGVFEPFGWFPVSYADDLAQAYGATSAAKVTRAHYDALKSAAARRASLLGKVQVDINDEDVPKIGA
ncbi:endolysin [Microbacterium phage Camille]|nr:endolysin [Microbacterium phage Camille]